MTPTTLVIGMVTPMIATMMFWETEFFSARESKECMKHPKSECRRQNGSDRLAEEMQLLCNISTAMGQTLPFYVVQGRSQTVYVGAAYT